MKITINDMMQEEKEVCPNRDYGFCFVDGSLAAFGNFLSLTWDDSGGYRNIIFPLPSIPLQTSTAMQHKIISTYVLDGHIYSTVAYFVYLIFLFSICTYLVKIYHLSISYTSANSILTA